MDEREETRAGGTGGEERRGAREKVSEGIRQGLGVLSALKDALEETIAEARERGDLSPDRAKEALRSALARAQEAAGEARERLDLVRQRDFDRLKERVEELGRRVEKLERKSAARATDRPG